LIRNDRLHAALEEPPGEDREVRGDEVARPVDLLEHDDPRSLLAVRQESREHLRLPVLVVGRAAEGQAVGAFVVAPEADVVDDVVGAARHVVLQAHRVRHRQRLHLETAERLDDAAGVVGDVGGRRVASL
jgi:hypothetical protein